MPQIKSDKSVIENLAKNKVLCYHCGTPCITASIAINDKVFCCEGCKLVYEIINENGLCDYYKLQSHPGLSQIKAIRNDKYTYLDNEDIARQLYKFTDGIHAIVTLYIPGVHCSSCMWLLEHMQRLDNGITESRLNFTAKEITIHFLLDSISLRKIVELLATIGYEPYISLEDGQKRKKGRFNKSRIYKLGVAGFCFGNIMMLSFPEYLSQNASIEHQYAQLFRYLNLLLSVPVFFYSASEFFIAAWKGLKHKMLNIDAPIVLALIITYTRSIYEITTGVGAGYLDSMSGIVFFMLVGRVVQDQTYRSLSFHRDYKSYFPIAVNVVTENGIETRNLQDLKEKDVVQLHNDEIIPADAVVISGKARIDYSFVTGESEPITIPGGAMLYAGGRQIGEQLIIQIIKPVASSYLTSLWNHYVFSKNKSEHNDEYSLVNLLSKYFTYILLLLAAVTVTYWAIYDPAKVLTSVSAMLIIACPCALLLSATYTNGSLLRIFSNNGLFLRDATVIGPLGNINHIVFDKTGTITQGSNQFSCSGHQLSEEEKDWVYTVASPSKHPYSKALVAYLGERNKVPNEYWSEITGMGIEGYINGNRILIGSAIHVGIIVNDNDSATVYVRIKDKVSAFYLIPDFRNNVPETINTLKQKYTLSLLSGDNDRQKPALEKLFGNSELIFRQRPFDKLHYIEKLQERGRHVLMIGDGLNDAGALQQSDVGITLTDDINNFTPSCDAILDAKKIARIPAIMKLAHASKAIITFSFLVSVVYNVVGLYIAVQGAMRPMVAAILMPLSTISIVLITTGVSHLLAKYYGLSLKN